MTTKQVINIHNFLVIQQNHWFVYLIAYLLISISQQSYKWPVLHPVIWFFLGMLPFLFYKIREKVRIPALCWVIYLPFLLGIYMIPVPHNVYIYINLGIAVYYCISSEALGEFLQAYENYKPVSLWVILPVSIVELIVLRYANLYEYQKGLLYLLIWNVMLFFIATYVNSYVKYLILGRHSIGYIPVGEVLCAGLYRVLSFSGVFALLALFVINVAEIPGAVVKEDKQLEYGQEMMVELEFEMPEMELQMGQANIQDKENNTSIFDIIMPIILRIALLLIAFRLIKFIFSIIIAMFTVPAKRAEAELEAQDIQDVVEKLNKKKRESFFEVRTPEMRIRRRFRKKVLNEKKTITNEGDSDRIELYTARVCSDILKKPVMAELYEKARYSPYECTAEDVKLMKEVCKN